MKFQQYLEYMSFRQYIGSSNIDKFICEIFNTKLEIRIIKSNTNEFRTEFYVNDNKFSFIAHSYIKNEWSIGFDKNNDIFFKEWNSKQYRGDVFTGVVESIKMLLQKQTVNKIIFNTESKNKHLIKFYDSKVVDRYIQHFGFKLLKRLSWKDSIGNMEQWIYERK